MLNPRNSRIYYGWYIVAAAFLINVASSPLNAGVFAFFVSPMSEDLGWSRSSLAWGMTCRLLVAGVTGPIVGVILDRHGTRLLGTLAGVIAGATTIALALIETQWQFYALCALSGLSGLGGPTGQLLTIVPVAKWFQANRGRALAITTVGLPLGATVYFIVAQRLIEAFGWREAWALIGVSVLLLAAPACLLLMRKDPEAVGISMEGEDASGNALDSAAPVVVEENWTAAQVMKSRTLWALIAAMALTGIALPGTVVYRVSYWEDLGMSAATVAGATALDPLTVAVSALIFGFASDRMMPRHMGLLAGGVVALSMVPLAIGQPSLLLLLAYNFLWGAGMGANITVNNMIWPIYFGRRFLGTIRGIVFPVSVVTSAISVPLYAGLLDLSPDPRYVWLMSLVIFGSVGLIFFMARRPRLSDLDVAPDVPGAVPETGR